MTPQQNCCGLPWKPQNVQAGYLIIEQDFNLFGVKLVGVGGGGAYITTILSQNFM
jgi:hypothetical protein